MSWRATAYVKALTHHIDGTRLSAREKLILFVLADYHHEEKNFAWVGIRKAAEDSLTSISRFVELIARIEKHGTLEISRTEGKSNHYYFPGLCRKSEQSPQNPKAKSEHTVPARSEHTVPIAAGTEPSLTGNTAIAPNGAALLSLLEDYYQRRWHIDGEGRRYLISPSTRDRVYEEDVQ